MDEDGGDEISNDVMDDANDEDYDPMFETIPDDLLESGNRTEFTSVFQRFGAKRALAPYITQLIYPRQFFNECCGHLDSWKATPLLAPFHEPLLDPMPSEEGDLGSFLEQARLARQKRKELSLDRKFSVPAEFLTPEMKQTKASMP